MLHDVLRAFEQSHGPVDIGELARKLGIDQSALDGMIRYWIRKGRLKENQFLSTGCSGSGCGSSCASGPQGCPFVGKMPRSISLVLLEEEPPQPRQ